MMMHDIDHGSPKLDRLCSTDPRADLEGWMGKAAEWKMCSVSKKRGVGSRNNRPFGFEKVYLPLCEVADTPFRIQGTV